MVDNRAKPWRVGYCDGVFNREYNNPWAQSGYAGWYKSIQYMTGYMSGKQSIREHFEKWGNYE